MVNIYIKISEIIFGKLRTMLKNLSRNSCKVTCTLAACLQPPFTRGVGRYSVCRHCERYRLLYLCYVSPNSSDVHARFTVSPSGTENTLRHSHKQSARHVTVHVNSRSPFRIPYRPTSAGISMECTINRICRKNVITFQYNAEIFCYTEVKNCGAAAG